MMAKFRENLIFLLTIFAMFYIEYGTAMKAKLTPSTITPKTATSVKLSCIPDENIDSLSDGIVVLEIKKEKEIIVSLRNENDIKYSTGYERKFMAQGRIDKVGTQSYLRAELLEPHKEDAGLYECLMYYLDQAGVLRMKASVANLTYSGRNMSQGKDAQAKTNFPIQHDDNPDLIALQAQLKAVQDQLAEQRQKEIDRPVFTAKYHHRTHKLNTGDTVVFDDILVSDGAQGYDPTTGIFTVPVSGIYNIQLTVALGKTGGFLNVDVMANSNVLGGATIADNNYDDQSSVSFLVRLVKGSKVRAVVRNRTNGSITVNFGNGWTFFSAYLVKE